jgi:ABC-2 type transport system ATP-binding protein/lipopolysaccharide transport system ATP-binding protein
MIRLAFATSTCLPPEILLMDEWLAAGDAHFLAKAQRRLENFIRGSSILVLASHSMKLIQEWCTHGVLLHQGRAVTIGKIDEVIAAYQEMSAG